MKGTLPVFTTCPRRLTVRTPPPPVVPSLELRTDVLQAPAGCRVTLCCSWSVPVHRVSWQCGSALSSGACSRAPSSTSSGSAAVSLRRAAAQDARVAQQVEAAAPCGSRASVHAWPRALCCTCLRRQYPQPHHQNTWPHTTTPGRTASTAAHNHTWPHRHACSDVLCPLATTTTPAAHSP